MEQCQRLNVPALRSEIVPRLQPLPSHTTEWVRDLRRDFTKCLRKAAPRAVLQLALSLLAEPGLPRVFCAKYAPSFRPD
jgi:hypothetical protein